MTTQNVFRVRNRLMFSAVAAATVTAAGFAWSQDSPGQTQSQPPTLEDTEAPSADQNSATLMDQHADDESPALGVIVGSCPGEGVCVHDTIWNSPADEAGLRQGDYSPID